MNELEQKLLDWALKSVQATPSGSDQPLQHILDPIDQHAETKRALESLRHQGFLTGLKREEETDSVFWSWQWDAEKVMAWGRSREPVYRFKGLPWVNGKDHFSAPGGKRAETIVGEYSVWYGVTSGCNGWHVTMPNVWGSQQCGSLDDGVELCEAHWLKTLIDSGVIERASNPH